MGDLFRPSRREHRDWSLLPSSLKASKRPTRSVPSLERSRTKSSNQEDFTRCEDLKRDSRERDQPGKNLVELDFQLWKPKRTDFRKSETTFPRHYTMLEGARAGNDDHARTGVLPPHPRRWRGNLPPESSSPGSLTGLWRRTPLRTPPRPTRSTLTTSSLRRQSLLAPASHLWI